MCGGYALSLFRFDELERLVCGLPHLDFQALQAAARYEAGFHKGHHSVQVPVRQSSLRDSLSYAACHGRDLGLIVAVWEQALWRIVQAFPLEQKKRFLSFCTGSDRCVSRGCCWSLAPVAVSYTVQRLLAANQTGREIRALQCVCLKRNYTDRSRHAGRLWAAC